MRGPAPAARAEPGRRSRRARRGQVPPPMSEINVTPFVDVMLVLLIIFMVAAPMLTVGVPVDLPRSAAQPLPVAAEEPLSVTLSADGSLAIQSRPVAPADLVPRLQAILAERSDRRLYLRADGAIRYDEVMRLMGSLSAAGFSDIALVTDPDLPLPDG